MAEERSQTRERWNFQTPNMKMLDRILELSTDPTKKDNVRLGLLYWWKALKPYHKGLDVRSGARYDLNKDWDVTLDGGKMDDERTSNQLGVIVTVLHNRGILLEEFAEEGPVE